MSHSPIPAKTINLTQSEKLGPSDQVGAKSRELISDQTPKQNTANKVKGHKLTKCTKRLSKEIYYDNNITGLIDKSETNWTGCPTNVPSGWDGYL